MSSLSRSIRDTSSDPEFERAYVAGPMRGVPDFNFPAFDEAAERLRHRGWVVFSPAAADRARGFEPKNCTGNEQFDGLRVALSEDLSWICENATVVVVLPGWEDSKGARAEVATARALGLRVLAYPELTEVGEDPTPGHPWPSTLVSVTTPEVAGQVAWGDGASSGAPNCHCSAAASLSGEVRVTSETGGQKGQKLARLGSLDPAALRIVAEVAGFGEEKYDRLNYLRGFDWSLSFDACQRHLLAFWSGQNLDPESGLPHLGHAAWQCLAMLAFLIHGLGTDDRFVPPGVAS